jgi:hypothetical protein
LHSAKEVVMSDAELYGFCLLGDGVTVRGMPLMNVLVTTPTASAVLDIIECTEHMEVGGKKDAKYIASIFEGHIAELDPYGIHLNAVLFDGASNVQKAGRVIKAKYPQVLVLHGIEHVISLFFSDVSWLLFCTLPSSTIVTFIVCLVLDRCTHHTPSFASKLNLSVVDLKLDCFVLLTLVWLGIFMPFITCFI